MPRRLRRRPCEGDPRDRRSEDAAQCLQGLAGLHDGGCDFIKTSTGKEGVNATLLVTLIMVRMIREYQERTGFKVGYKPAGGISRPPRTPELPDPDEGRTRPPLA
jgi:hypothetical protein